MYDVFTISRALAVAVAVNALSFVAQAAPGHSGGHELPYGESVSAAQAKRTVTITVKDNLYEPKTLTVKPGETIRFVVINKGELLHEFALGRPEDHAEHQKMMAMMMDHGMITPTGIDRQKMKMPGMEMHQHTAESGSVLIEPGKTAEITWKFSQPMTLEFACTVPGHYESGMVGKINFTR